MLADGSVVAWSAQNRTEYSAGPGQLATNLQDLLVLAETAVVQHSGPRSPGRKRRIGESLVVDSIERRDLIKITTAANTVARYLKPGVRPDGVPEVLRGIRGSHLLFDPHAGPGGAGDWRVILELVEEASDALSPKETTSKVAAIRKLMDLAATRCWIPRTERHSCEYQPVPAEWALLYQQWRDSLSGSGLNAKVGLMALFEACARLAQNPSEAKWEEVVEHLEDTFVAQRTPSPRRSDVRRVYRALRQAGVIQGPGWDGHERKRAGALCPVTNSAIWQLAGLYGSDTPQLGLHRDVPLTGFERVHSLMEGPWGYRRALVHFTCPEVLAADHGVPERAVYQREQYRQISSRTGLAWRRATIVANTASLFMYVGFLEQHRGVSFGAGGADLWELLNNEHLWAYRKWVVQKTGRPTKTLVGACRTLARLASPYLEAIALEAGDERAQLAAAASAMLYSERGYVNDKGQRVKSWVKAFAPSFEERKAAMRRKALRIQAVWTKDGQACEFAYEQSEAVLAELCRQLVAMHPEAASLEQQVVAIESGWQPDREWARLVRDTLYWQDQLTVPLRGGTSSRLDLRDRRHTADFRRIWAEIASVKMKAGGDFTPNYALGDDSPYQRVLYQLYVMRGGARQVLRTAEGGTHDIAAFYVPDLRTTSEERIPTAGFADIVARLVQRAEHALMGGVDYSELKRCGALGTHFFRHQYGTIMVRKGLADIAAYYLHHADMTMIREVYSADGAEAFDAAAMLARVRRPAA